jgi:nitroreductase
MIDPIANRFSPMHFQIGKEISENELNTLFDAARWAASSFNEQPWNFVYAFRSDKELFEKFLSFLTEYNQKWASTASVLAVAVASEDLQQTGKANAYSWYDTGQAVAQMVVQASAMGLQGHQMGGFDKEIAREVLGIPAGYQPVAVIALGYPAPLDEVPGEFSERAHQKRDRRPLESFVFRGAFGK